MTNKYLEKIAIFGLSKEEKRNSVEKSHYIALNNTFANHVNPVLKKINNTNTDKLDTEKGIDSYVTKVLDEVRKSPTLYSDYQPHHSKYKASLRDLGVDLKQNHKEIMDDFCNRMGDSYRQGLRENT